jgi:osmoprotectant transport system permease protein
VLDGLRAELKRRDGVVLLAPLGFENAYALAMRRDRAQALGIRTLADLAAKAPQLTMGGDLEFFSRPEWASVETAYGLRFKAKRQFQPTFMYRALGSGEADVISAFSSDGRIAADDLVVLADPKGALPPYDAVLLIAPGRAEDRRLRDAGGAGRRDHGRGDAEGQLFGRPRYGEGLADRGGEGAGGGAEALAF